MLKVFLRNRLHFGRGYGRHSIVLAARCIPSHSSPPNVSQGIEHAGCDSNDDSDDISVATRARSTRQAANCHAERPRRFLVKELARMPSEDASGNGGRGTYHVEL